MIALSLMHMQAALYAVTQTDVFTVFGLQDFMGGPEIGWEGFVDGWMGMTDLGVLVPMVVSILTAVFLALPIAYHPRLLRRATTIEEIEAPKGIIVYAAVSAGIAQVVVLTPAMALVVFGIGGVYRFRTRAGPPKHIGPTIGAVVIGLACGMMAFPLAIVLAFIFIVLPFWFESRYAVSLQVKNIKGVDALEATRIYGDELKRHGGQIVSIRAVRTAQFSILAKVPASVNEAELEEAIRKLPSDAQGQVRWDTR